MSQPPDAACELIMEYSNILIQASFSGSRAALLGTAKKCALAACNALIEQENKLMTRHGLKGSDYWIQVMQEIKAI